MAERDPSTKEWHGAARGGDSSVVLMVAQAKEKSVRAAAEGIHSHLEVRTRGLRPVPVPAADDADDADDADGTDGTDGTDGAGPHAAEVIVIDCSDSMRYPRSKIEAAREAAIGAVAALRHGTRFAVVQGTHRATMVYPTHEGLATAGHDTVAHAKERISRLFTSGGTAIGAWLGQVRRLLADCPGDIRHAILLTDGRNEHNPELLPRELDACEGLFTCDAWGIGHDWNKQELRMIADRLHGSADIVLNEADLAAKFEAAIRASMARTVATLPIRITLTLGTRIRYFKQLYPRELDLTAEGRPVDEQRRTVEFPTHAWSGEERRQYHLCLEADPAGQPEAEDLRLGMAEVVTPPGVGSAPEPVPLLVNWLPGERKHTEHRSRPSWHFDRHADLGRAVAEGCEAHERRDLAAAEDAFRRAVELARGLGDHRMLGMLADFMDIEGNAGLKADFDPRLLDRIWLRSSETTPDDDPDDGAGPERDQRAAAPPGPVRVCQDPDCGGISPPDARNCLLCGGGEFAA